MKLQNYVEGQKFCRLTDLTICPSTDTCCFNSCFHEKNMRINKTALRYMLKSLIFNGTYRLVKIRVSAFSAEVQQSYFAVTGLQSPSSCENCDKISRYLSFHRLVQSVKRQNSCPLT